MFAFLKNLEKDLCDALMIQLRNLWTHASTAIEGNTLTLGETAFVLEEGLTVSGKPLKDHEEVVGHARAIDLIYKMVKSKSKLTDQDLFDLHKAVQTERIVDVYKPLGAWKVEPNSTVMVLENRQTIFEFAAPGDVPALMVDWLSLFNEISGALEADKETAIAAYVDLHVSFVRIHPFWDGNGRLARLVSNIPVIGAGYPPIIIPKEGRREYIEALSEYHLAVGTAEAGKELLPQSQMLERFRKFCTDSWSESIRLVEEALEKQRKRGE